MVESDKAKIGLMGIKPTFIQFAKYGYILTENGTGSVKGFQEKPSEALVEELIADGANVNGGVYVQSGLHHGYLGILYFFKSFEDVREQYSVLAKNQFRL